MIAISPIPARLAIAALGVALLGCATAPARSGAPPLDRSVMPAPGPTPAYDFPEIQRRTLSNGLRLWIVERPGIPIVTLQLVAEAGAVADPADAPGLASLTAAMMMEGTATRTSRQIADELDFLAANMSVTALQEVSLTSMTTLARNLEPSLAILADVLVNPGFPASEWPRVRDGRLAALVQALDQPATIATQQFGRLVYGDAHPLGRPILGTPAAVQAATPGQLRDFYRRTYVPNASHLIVVGDVRTDAITAQLESAFTGWRRAEPPRQAPLGEPAPLDATRIYLFDKPGAAQSQIRIGHVGVARAHEDYFPLLVMNTLLGGQFTSRINLNLREDKGYTYGARSSFDMARLAGPFVAQAGVQTAVTKESLLEFMKELTEIRGDRPATSEELDFARTSIIRREPLTLETNAQIAARVQDLIRYDLPLDYFDEYNARIAAVTLDDVNRVAREYLHPERFAIVVVGDRARIEQSLRELSYPVEVVPLPDVATPARAGASGEQ